MRLKRLVSSALIVVGGLVAQPALAHFDFVPKIVSGQVATAGHDDGAGIDVNDLRVGGYDFGETAGDPYNIGDPGFNSLGATSFAAGTQLRLRGLPVDGKFLRYWDGTGSPSFGAAPAGVTLDLAGSPTRLVTFSDSALTYIPASTPSLLIGSFSANGSIHVHVTSSIYAGGLQVADSVPEGAYLISFDLFNPASDGITSTGVTASDPLFIVYNNGLSEELHDEAIEQVQATPVPEPAAISSLLLGAAALLRRGRRTAAATRIVHPAP